MKNVTGTIAIGETLFNNTSSGEATVAKIDLATATADVVATTDTDGRFLNEDGYPAVAPPWGTLNAIDLNKGEILWKVPLGEYEELTAKGYPKTGTENYGGPLISAGNLIFIGATNDHYFRAFNKETGE